MKNFNFTYPLVIIVLAVLLGFFMNYRNGLSWPESLQNMQSLDKIVTYIGPVSYTHLDVYKRQTEYGSTPYLLFMLGEYVAIMSMCAMTTILFLGGWLPPINAATFTWVPGVVWFVFKVSFVFFLFAMAKAMVPRYRYDQLMRLGWKVFLPLSLAAVVLTAAFLQTTGWYRYGAPVAIEQAEGKK